MRDCDFAKFVRMLEVMMRASCADVAPSVLFQKLDDFSAVPFKLHDCLSELR